MCTYLALSKDLEDGLLDLVCVLVEAHVLQHHDTAKQQRGRVSETLASDVRGGTVHGLEDGALVTDVSRGSETETTDQTGAHVRKNVSVKVGHDEHLIVVGQWVRYHLQTGVVEELGVELNARVLLAQLLGGLEEETVGHLHDGGLVDGADLLAANVLSVLEGEAEHALRGLPCDKLDGLDNTVDHDVLDSGVLALGVLTDQDSVDIVVGGLVAGDRLAGTDVGEEVKGSAKGQVQGDVALANRGLRGISIRLPPLHSQDTIAHTARGPLSAT